MMMMMILVFAYYIFFCLLFIYLIQIYSGIARGRVLNGELYTHTKKIQKLIFLMSARSESFSKQPVGKYIDKLTTQRF